MSGIGIGIKHQPWLSTWYRTANAPAAQWSVPIPNAAAPVNAGGPAGNYYRVSPSEMSRALNSGVGCVGCGEVPAGEINWFKTVLIAGGLFVGLKWFLG